MSRIIGLNPVSTQGEFMQYLVRNTPRRAGSRYAVRLAKRRVVAAPIRANIVLAPSEPIEVAQSVRVRASE
jgi:hypothetical protein